MKTHAQSISTVPTAPDDDRRKRMVRYSIAMGIRVLCLISILFVHGWWIIIPALGAVFLPYFAVVIANVGWNPSRETVERPGSIVRVDERPAAPHDDGEPRS
jgi:hypothetical protein